MAQRGAMPPFSGDISNWSGEPRRFPNASAIEICQRPPGCPAARERVAAGAIAAMKSREGSAGRAQ